MKNKIVLSFQIAVLASLLISLPAFAETAKSSPAVKPGTCEQKIKALILRTAKAMGQKREFGFELARAPEGVDSLNRPLFSYNSNVFIVPEGYISNSAARVIVRSPDTACEVVKLAVSIGG